MRTSAAAGGEGSDLGRYDEADDDARGGRRRGSDERQPRAPGLFWRTVRLVRFLVFILPLCVLLIGSFVVDCRNRSAFGFLPDFVGRSACARAELTGHLSGLDQTMRTISQVFR